MSGNPDPRPAARTVDPHALAVARLAEDECGACGRPPGSPHHVIPRSEGGDDVAANLLMLCGSGTTGCHGAWHGNPYMASDGRWVALTLPEQPWRNERRDAVWVAQRIGHHIASRRRDIIAYVVGKLGDEPGRLYLLRRYHLEV